MVLTAGLDCVGEVLQRGHLFKWLLSLVMCCHNDHIREQHIEQQQLLDFVFQFIVFSYALSPFGRSCSLLWCRLVAPRKRTDLFESQ